MGMGGMAGMGSAGTGAILGGIGDIIAAANYERPELQKPGYQERALRRLALNQLEGGGQQLLGATSLYNSMAPILMGMLPGMSYRPGTPGTAAHGGAAGAAGAGGSPLGDYSSALSALQSRQAATARVRDLKKQRQQAKGPERRALRDQIVEARKQLKATPAAGRMQQTMYRAGTTAPSELYNVSRGTAPMGTGSGTGAGATLALVRGLMAGSGGQAS